ncbi:MAG: MFS transporter [Spirochaetaceae bacterium]|jgi:MFS family permease|nr:MFS transporter [Spirochaetaceae bacterium]
MSVTALSPYRLGKARELYNIFNVFNALSWNFLVGSIITLFAMRLGASSTYIGLLSALLYVSYFFLPLGKLLARRFSIVGVFSFTWIFRAIVMVLVVAAPFAEMAGNRDLALGLLMLGVMLFHVFRGIGMIGNNPVLSELAAGPDRGAYMTQIQIINSAIAMFAGFLIAITLGREPPIYFYSIILTVGIACGIFSGALMRKIPEPPGEENGTRVSLSGIFRKALSQPAVKRFAVIFFIVALVSGISRAFIVVYAREVFLQTDGMVSLYTVFGGLGNLIIGLLIKFLVDRIGAKPIFIVCVFIGLFSMIPVVFFPAGAVNNMTTAILFLTFLFFVLNFGFLGAEGIAQTYFMGLVPLDMMMNMGILYFFIFGVAGAGGAFLAGLFLDILTGFGITVFLAFKILFAILTVLTAVALILQRKLTPLGALPFMGALEVMFSARDLRAISILDRLSKTRDSHEEEQLLGALHNTPSKLAIKGLLERARSPRLAVRLESLRAMEALETLNEDAEKALIADLINNPFTTAYISARILGNHGCFSAIPLLRELATSKDYMLAGEAMIALARLGDEAFRPQMERIILKTNNPRLRIMGVEAFGIYGSPNSLSVLLDILKIADPPPYLRDEVTLAMAAILDIQNQFYPLLVRYLEDHALIVTLAMDEAESAYEFYLSSHGHGRGRKKDPEFAFYAKQAKAFQGAVSAFIREKNGAPLSRWVLELPGNMAHAVVQVVLSEALLDDEFCTFDRLRLLIVHWAAHELRVWTKKMK